MSKHDQPSGNKVKILVNWQGAPDGVTTHDYTAGEEYEVGTSLMPEDFAHELANCGVISDEHFGTKDSEVKEANVKAARGERHAPGGSSTEEGFAGSQWYDRAPAEPSSEGSKYSETGKASDKDKDSDTGTSTSKSSKGK